MGKGNEELTHWLHRIEVGEKDGKKITKYNTKFGIVLCDGFTLEIDDKGFLQVWLKRTDNLFKIQLMVPYTTGRAEIEIDGKYVTNNKGSWIVEGSHTNKLVTWKPKLYFDKGLSNERSITVDASIDRSKEAMVLWPNKLVFWEGSEKSPPNFTASADNPADYFPMNLDLETYEKIVKNLYEKSEHEMPDDWQEVEVIMIESETEEETDSEPDVLTNVSKGYNLPQKKENKKPQYQELSSY